MAITMTMSGDIGSSDWDMPLSSLFPPSASRNRRRTCSHGNRRPLPDPFRELVDDLVVEILIRLPNPRSSCRCRAVCKRWRSLISDPSFDRRFISHSRSRYRPSALFLPAHDPQSVLSFLPAPENARPQLRVFDCFEDLLLCGFVKFSCELRRSYLICNPFTKQWIALPLAPETPPAHYVSAAGLVCQPRSNCNYNLVQQQQQQRGDEGEATSVYSEYRFRVVCLFQHLPDQIVEVFCSESGEWTLLFLENYLVLPLSNALTWKGKFYWAQENLYTYRSMLAVYDPFRPYMLPASMPIASALWDELRRGNGNFSISQGAFHVILFRGEHWMDSNSLSVWRREEDCWRRKYETELKMTSPSLWGDYKLEHCYVLDLHPEKPEIVFFRHLGSPECIFSCNLSTGMGEPEFVSAQVLYSKEPCWRALQPRVSCWPTPIPRYEELRGMYDGSYDCFVQNSATVVALGSTIEECQPLVEQSGDRRKGKR